MPAAAATVNRDNISFSVSGIPSGRIQIPVRRLAALEVRPFAARRAGEAGTGSHSGTRLVGLKALPTQIVEEMLPAVPLIPVGIEIVVISCSVFKTRQGEELFQEKCAW